MKFWSQALPENDKGRDFVVADIHGCFDLFEKALKAVGFDPDKDRVFAIGDLIDRGPQSDKCIEYLDKPWFHAIRGNHEDVFCYIVTKDGDIDLSRKVTKVPSFMQWILDETPEDRAALREKLLQLPAVIEIRHKEGGRTGLVHGDVPHGMHWDAFTELIDAQDGDTYRIANWSHHRFNDNNDSGVRGVNRVFLGHSPTEGPKKLGNCFFIDTGGAFRAVGESTLDFYISIIDIKTEDEAILNPVRTQDDLVRTVQAERKPPAPVQKPRAPGL